MKESAKPLHRATAEEPIRRILGELLFKTGETVLKLIRSLYEKKPKITF